MIATRSRLVPAAALLAVLSVTTPAAAAPSPAPTPQLTKTAADALGLSSPAAARQRLDAEIAQLQQRLADLEQRRATLK